MAAPPRAPPCSSAREIRDRVAVVAASAGDESPRRRIHHVARGVDGDDCARRSGHPAASIAALPIPPFIARSPRSSLPTVAPAPAPTLPSVTGSAVAARAAAYPQSAPGRIAPLPTCKSYRIAAGTIGTTPALVEKPTCFSSRYFDDSVRGCQAEGAATGKHDGVNLLDEIRRVEQIGLAGARRAAANVDARNRALLRQDHRAAGRPLREGVSVRPSYRDGG